MRGHTGYIHITTIIMKAGSVTRDIGTTRTTTTAIGVSMIMGGAVVITATMTNGEQ